MPIIPLLHSSAASWCKTCTVCDDMVWSWFLGFHGLLVSLVSLVLLVSLFRCFLGVHALVGFMVLLVS